MRRCLIVDDSPLIRKVARVMLERMQFHVDEAENGQLAIDRCKAQLPDAILLDWHLPVMGAMEFLAQLRTLGGRKPYIVYCTTENDPTNISRAFAAGADDFLLKPFVGAEIQSKFVDVSLGVA